MRKWLDKLELGIEELILVFLIVIEALDFFTLIPAPLEYAEKTLAIIAMCYIFYKASLTKIIFGFREKNYDVLLVVAYLLLSLKTVVGFMISSVEEAVLLKGFYLLVIQNAGVIEKTGFIIGGITLILLAAALVKEKVKKPCIMSIIHEDKKAEKLGSVGVRFLSIYIILLSIFIVVFSFAVEWLTMSADAPLMMIVLMFYLFVVVKRGRGMKAESFLKNVSETSEHFYEKFISLFHSRKTITAAITGLLVLHLLVEIGTFVIPYTTGLLYPKYFAQLGPGHAPLGNMMVTDFALASGWLQQAGVMAVYVLNVMAVLMLFFGPAYAWYYLYKGKRVAVPNILWLYFGSLAAFIMLPVLRIGQVKTSTLVGADITTQSIPFIDNIGGVLLIAAMVAAIFYLLGKKNLRRTTQIAFLTVFVYFGIYLYHFFINLAKYYVSAVTMLARGGEWFLAAHLLIFLTITILFYVCGYLMFLYESYHRQKI